jgi:hypothetical protein
MFVCLFNQNIIHHRRFFFLFYVVSLLLLPSGLVKQFQSGAKLMLSDKNYYYTADRDMAKLVYSFHVVFSP